jgi:hypothetical protein
MIRREAREDIVNTWQGKENSCSKLRSSIFAV